MNAIPYDRPEEEWDSYEEGTEEVQDDFALPGRPRRQWFNRKSAALFAVVLGAIGFYAGVRVEKNQLSNSSSTAGARRAPAALRASAGAAGPRGRRRTGAPARPARLGPAPAEPAPLRAPARAPAGSAGCSVAAPAALPARAVRAHLRNRQHDQRQHSLHHRGHR